jgi:NAD(P)-dependent dehydrogenase (short-subunit alcohol dehydrogenase family)
MRKVVLITGGTRGIGAGLASQLDPTNCDVWVAGRNHRCSISPGVRFFNVDFSVPSDVSRFISELVKVGRPIDVLVNNAATLSDALLGPRQLSENYIVNVASPASLTQSLQHAELLKCVINVVSDGASRPAENCKVPHRTGLDGYFETKFRFAQVQAYLASQHGTHCLFYSPGATDTALQAKALRSAVTVGNRTLFQIVSRLNSLTLHSAHTASTRLRELCEHSDEYRTHNVVHWNGKLKKIDWWRDRKANESAYRELVEVSDQDFP